MSPSGGGGDPLRENDISFRDYQAKGDEKRQGERGGPKIGKMGRRRLWMAPNIPHNFQGRTLEFGI